MNAKIRLVGTMEMAYAFFYLGDVFACDGLDWRWSPAQNDGWLDEGLSRWIRSSLLNEHAQLLVPVPDRQNSFAAMSGSMAVTPLILGGIPSDLANSRARRLRALIQQASRHDLLLLAQKQASEFIYRRLATHGIPNVTKWLVSTCDQAERAPDSDRDKRIQRIKGCAGELRSIIDAERYLDPSWAPDNSARGRYLIHKALRKAEGLLRPDAVERGVTVSLPNTMVKIHANAADLNVVLFNLMSNGIKYAKRRTSIDVSFSRTPEQFTVSFAMQSLNIEPDEAALVRRILARGRRAQESGSTGQGIGLAIVDRVLAGYSGKMDMEPGMPNSVEPGFSQNRFHLHFPSNLVSETGSPAGGKLD